MQESLALRQVVDCLSMEQEAAAQPWGAAKR